MNNETIKLTVVIPIFNEEDSLKDLVEGICEVLKKIEPNYEVIAVDDGSTDKTLSLLRGLHDQNSKLKMVSFRRNFGQTAALQAGFDQAKGEVVITLDADLENDPQDIPKLLQKLDEGYDVVSGWRKNRWRGSFLQIFLRKIPSSFANYLISKISGVPLHDSGCTLKAYRREILKDLRLYGDSHRFIPSLLKQTGARITEIEVNYRPRKFGKSKYGLSRTMRVFLDLLLLKFLLNFLTRPIQIFGLLGVLFSGLGIVFGLYLTSLKIFLEQDIGNRPLLLLSVLLTLLGFQFIVLGLLGEVVVRTYFESQGRKTYVIKEIVS